MGRIEFTSLTFQIGLVVILIALIFFDSFKALATGNPAGFIPVAIEIILVFLILGLHKWMVPFLKSYAIIFLMGVPLLKVAVKGIEHQASGFSEFGLNDVSISLVLIGIGTFILLGVRKYVRPYINNSTD